MGMAASQARLLSLTARIHDVEYEAQSIQNAKVQLSTQSDQVYNDYLEALDATTLTIKDMDGNKVTATFNNLFGINAVDSGNSYSLKDSRGRVIVSDEIADAYEVFKANNECSEMSGSVNYGLALSMYYGEGNGGDSGNTLNYGSLEDAETTVYENHTTDSKADSIVSIKKSMDEILTKYKTGDSDDDSYSNMAELADSGDTTAEKDLEKYDELEASWRKGLYNLYADEIAKEANFDVVQADEFDYDKFNTYLRIFKEMEQCGYVCISSYNGSINGNAASDNEWLTNMVQCGKITIDIVTMDNKTGEIMYNTTSPSSDTYVDYTTTTEIDKTALAKAEAEYEHETSLINKKDEKFDLELSKLESERTALTTEYESVKKVIEDNIERTFGIFS